MARAAVVLGRRAASGVLAGALLLLGSAGQASASPGGTITVDPTATTVPAKLIVDGWCAEPRPETTQLSLDGAVVTTVSVDPALGTWGPERVLLGADAKPGSHLLTTSCGGSATVTVTGPARPATLQAQPARSRLPVSVTLTGTCPEGTRSVELLVDGHDGGPLPIDVTTGVLTATTLRFDVDTPLGSHTLSTSCGGSTSFTALVTPAPSTSPTTSPTTSPSSSKAPVSGPASSATAAGLVRVPDLVGMTESQAIAVLGDSLRLARVRGTSARIRTQDPSAGAMVAAGTTVTVTFASPAPWWESSRTAWSIAGGAALLLLLVAGAWWVGYVRQGRRRPPPSSGPGGAHGTPGRPPAPVPTASGRRR